MIQLQNDFTSPEQSKHLMELGIPLNTADCYYDRDEVEIDERPYVYVIPKGKTFTEYSIDSYIPCWTVGRLIELLLIRAGGRVFCYEHNNTPLVDSFIQRIEYWKNQGYDFSKIS